jgi:hypothetical protein
MDVISQSIEPVINSSTQDDSGAKLSDVQVGANLGPEEVNISTDEHTGAMRSRYLRCEYAQGSFNVVRKLPCLSLSPATD